MNLSQYFETRKRDSGESFVTLKDDSPKWLLAAIRDAHQGTLPNDWIFEACKDACEAIDSGVLTDEDSVHEYVDGAVDVYNGALWAWAAKMHGTDTFAAAEEEAQELGLPQRSLTEQLGTVQFCALRYIAEVMLNAYNEQTQGES